jgi:hypothetical protein
MHLRHITRSSGSAHPEQRIADARPSKDERVLTIANAKISHPA